MLWFLQKHTEDIVNWPVCVRRVLSPQMVWMTPQRFLSINNVYWTRKQHSPARINRLLLSQWPLKRARGSPNPVPRAAMWHVWDRRNLRWAVSYCRHYPNQTTDLYEVISNSIRHWRQKGRRSMSLTTTVTSQLSPETGRGWLFLLLQFLLLQS